MALIILGVVVFVAGAVVLARPFVHRRSTLLVVVPVAAAACIAVLGGLALVCAAVIAIVQSPDRVGEVLNDVSWPVSGRRSRRKNSSARFSVRAHQSIDATRTVR